MSNKTVSRVQNNTFKHIHTMSALSGKFTRGLYSVLYDHIQVITPHILNTKSTKPRTSLQQNVNRTSCDHL